MKYILAIDQGTTGTTSLLVNASTLEFIDRENLEHPQFYPTPGLVEHDLDEIWSTVKFTTLRVLERNHINPKNIVSIGITNQRETTCAFTKNGVPLSRAIVWQDRRTEDFCNQLKNDGLEKFIKHKTGLTIDPYFSSTKIHWLLQNNDKVKAAYKNSDALFGTIDTFLTYKLTGHKCFVTEPTNASRTMLLDINTGTWDSELLKLFNISPTALAEVRDTFSKFGETSGLDFLPDGIPITCLFGDQQSALFGQSCLEPGQTKVTYGTGAFMLLNIGEKIVYSKNGLLTTIANSHKGKRQYALEGSCYIAGAAVQWLRDNLKIIKKSSDIESLALQVKNLVEMKFVYFLPFFTGIGSPHWKSNAKASIVGLTRDTTNAHLARACLEGICFSINDLIETMRKDSGLSLEGLKVDGGAVVNDLLMNMQATISSLTIIRPKIIETTAYGAALGSSVGMGDLNFDGIKKLWKSDTIFEKNKEWDLFYKEKYEHWKLLIKKLYL